MLALAGQGRVSKIDRTSGLAERPQSLVVRRNDIEDA
jgi:hypothetical protein